MEERKYVVIRDNKIVGGPYVWDGMTNWTPPEEGQLMLEEEATKLGLTKIDRDDDVDPDPVRKTD